MGKQFSKLKRSKSKKKRDASTSDHSCHNITHCEIIPHELAPVDKDDECYSKTDNIYMCYEDMESDETESDATNFSEQERKQSLPDGEEAEYTYESLPVKEINLKLPPVHKFSSKNSDYSRFSLFKKINTGRGENINVEKHPGKSDTAWVPDNLVPQMVDAFRPLIEECIRVNEVVPYLPFLADHEEIQAKERESPKRAAGLLLDQIISSEEPGKWTTFLNALKTVGYEYVANLLRGVTEVDLAIQRNLLKVFTPKLVNNLEPSEIIDHLYSRGVISVVDKEEIECELRNRGPSAASLKLLDRIPRRTCNWYNEFVDVLRACEFGFLADILDIPEATDSTISSECLLSVPLAACTSTQKEDCYITPQNSIIDLNATHKFKHIPPPLPKRPEVKKDEEIKRNTQSMKPSSSEYLKKASVGEMINANRRLAMELDEIKQKRKLFIENKRLQNQIEELANVEIDEEAIVNSVGYDNSLGFEDRDDHVEKIENGIQANIKVESIDKAVQTVSVDTLLRNSIQADNTTKARIFRVGDEDIKLSDVTLTDLLNSVTYSVLQKVETAGRSEEDITDRNLPNPLRLNSVKIFNPKPHTGLQEYASDSGMYSNFYAS